MLERMKDVLRNRKEGDKGFSLVELAVVIVIIGILVAIAVPVFASIQGAANDRAVEAAAANGSAMVAAELAVNPDTTAADLTDMAEESLVDGDVVTGITVTISDADNAISTYCVQADGKGASAAKGTSPSCAVATTP